MRDLFQLGGACVAMKENAQEFIRELFSRQTVGAQLANRLIEIEQLIAD
jgi:hypothetical protein